MTSRSKVTTSCSSLDLLKTSVDGGHMYNTMPPSAMSQVTFPKRVDMNMVCSISSVALVNEMVPRTSGAIVWLPGRGVNSCYRMGIVPSGTLSSGSGTEPANTRPYFRAGNGPLQYLSPLPIPYNNRITSDVIEFSPSLVDSSISRARLYAGYMSVLSDTTPVGALALNGTLSAAAVSDITDVFQPASSYTFGTVSTNGALDISQLVQSAVLVKDCVKEVSVSKGITAVIGPDIAASLNDTDFNTTFVQNGRLLGVIPIKDPLSKGAIGTLNTNTLAEQWSGWISPWNTKLTGNWGNYHSVAVPNFYAGPINPFGGCLAFDVQFNIITNNNASANVQSAGYMENWFVHFYHVFASCSSDGSITYNSVLDVQPMMCYNQMTTGASTYKMGQWRLQAKSNPKPRMGQPDVFNNSTAWQPVANGMYIGTQINISSSNLSSVAGNTTPGVDKGWVIDPDMNPSVIVYSVNDQVPGELGPCRIVRYDNLSAGQILKVDGSFMAECLPGATTAPFVQASGSMARVCSNVNALSFLSFAYNSDDTPFRRCWVTSDWEDYKANYLPNINAKVIRSFSTARLLMAAAAAGVLTEGTCEDDENNGIMSGMDVSSVAGGILPTAIGTVVGKTASSVVGSALKRSRSLAQVDQVDNSNDKYLKAQIEGAVIKALGTNPLFTPSNVAARLSQLDRVMGPVGTERSKALMRAAYNEQQ